MLWEILKASKGILVADFYADLWANIAGGGTPVDIFVEMVGSLPLYYNGKGYDLTDYLISGNTVQDGTPSADAPVEVQGCGVRTGNLLNLNRTYSESFTTDTTMWMNGAATVNNVGAVYAKTEILGDVIKVTSKRSGYGASFIIEASPNTTYTVSFETDKTSSGSWGGISDRDINGTVISSSSIQGKSATFTTHSDCAFLNVCFRFPPADGTVTFSKVMLALGSTALPYEPYGYKLDISSGGENLAWTGWAQDFVGRIGAATRASIVTDDGRECLKYNVSAGYRDYDTKYIFKTEWKENTRYSISFYGKRPTGMTTAGVMQLIYTDDTYEEIRVQSAGVGNYVQYVVMSAAGKTVKSLCADYTSGSFIIDINTFMVNEGDTAKPYSPYNRTSTPIYLGTVPTTRRVKKLVLTGEENWQIYTSASNTYRVSISNTPSIGNPAMCSHFVNSPIAQIASGKFTVGSTWIYIRYADVADLADFKSYLAAQYQNGTPVTVWYVLAEPETAIVNEPLMKIGDYADTVSAAQAGVTIPTVSGANVLDMASPVKPSEMYIKGKGIKPTGYGQLTDVNGVNILDKDGRPIYGRASDRR